MAETGRSTRVRQQVEKWRDELLDLTGRNKLLRFRPSKMNQQVRRGVYHDVPELIAAIEYFIEHYNERAQPFVWTKTPEQILTKTTKQQATSGTLQ